WDPPVLLKRAPCALVRIVCGGWDRRDSTTVKSDAHRTARPFRRTHPRRCTGDGARRSRVGAGWRVSEYGHSRHIAGPGRPGEPAGAAPPLTGRRTAVVAGRAAGGPAGDAPRSGGAAAGV